ncbi:MAG TPA: biopolymer transporter ExbD [Ignavibacteriales bacterium]|nr:biopolymer transporter ExbD [Ignavibacteriales bacterium]
MADIDTSGSGKHGKGKKKTRKKASTRVDLTPMVDLGFLLVTFFMLTTTFSKPQTMEINLPVKPKSGEEADKGQAVKESKAMTILIGADNTLYYYMGITDPQVEKSDFLPNGIRKVLLEKNREIRDLIVLIKPSDESSYRNVVDILDEMNIANIKRYALVDITPQDIDLLKTL